MGDGWTGQVLSFWFEELTPKDWFVKRDATDDMIRERFGKTYEAVAAGTVPYLARSADQALAAVIVADQFPRNMFRNTPRSFATDALALEIARRSVEAGYDKDVAAGRRVFFYMPFEHSEALADQDLSVDLISALGIETFTDYAIRHRDVIRRFGRFPHRNAILGRASTPEEIAYLAEPGSGF